MSETARWTLLTVLCAVLFSWAAVATLVAVCKHQEVGHYEAYCRHLTEEFNRAMMPGRVKTEVLCDP